MKKTLILLFLLLSIGAQAQDKKAKERIDEIRALYNEAKQKVEYNNMLTETRNELTIVGSFMCPGTGHRDETIKFYFTTDFDEESSNYVSKPYLIIRSYNVAAHKFYEEMLYDDEGNLIFMFLQNDSYADEGGKDEIRFYWGKNGLVHKAVKGEPATDEVLACRLSYDLLEAFNRVMNREF